MIVDRFVAHAILSGQITQARLPVSPDGPTKATPARGRRMNITTARGHACTVTILGCHRQDHQASLTTDALHALGHDTLADHARQWLLARDGQWLARRVPHGLHAVTSDEEAEAALAALTDEQILERFAARWADRPVWVVSFAAVQDPPRLLAQSGGVRYRRLPDGRWEIDESEDRPDVDSGYTQRSDQALPGEPEAVDVDRLRPEWARRAAERHARARDRRDVARELARSVRAA